MVLCPEVKQVLHHVPTNKNGFPFWKGGESAKNKVIYVQKLWGAVKRKVFWLKRANLNCVCVTSSSWEQAHVIMSTEALYNLFFGRYKNTLVLKRLKDGWLCRVCYSQMPKERRLLKRFLMLSSQVLTCSVVQLIILPQFRKKSYHLHFKFY